MRSNGTPCSAVLARVEQWCGVHVDHECKDRRVRLHDRVIARFPSDDTLEAVLCGSLRRRVMEEPEALPEGVWAHDDKASIIIDLTTPRGMEEAIRTLMNVYMTSQSSAAQDWWLNEQRLDQDPTCEKIAEIVRRYRKLEGRLAEPSAPAETDTSKSGPDADAT